MHKRGKIIWIVLCVCMILCLLLLSQFVNTDTKASDVEISKEMYDQEMNLLNQENQEEETSVEKPVFSKESGFYEKEFELTMEAPEGTKIYYTTDSTVPTTSSREYEGGIQITDASDDDNRYCTRTDFEPYTILPLYDGQEQTFPGYYCRYMTPQSKVDKCRVIRAIAVDQEGNCSDVMTASYFINYGNKAGYDNMTVLSLVSDPDGLFGDKGIMVNGNIYNEKFFNGEFASSSSTFDSRDYTNTYAGRGKEWEREVHMDFFDGEQSQEDTDSNGDRIASFSQEAGIRLHGNQSRVAEVQKSFNLYAREEYDGSSTFHMPFFGDHLLSDTVTLMRGNDPRNYYLCQLMDNRTMFAQKYRMVQVFLDGEYWGLYAIQERYSSNQYIKRHYDLDTGEYSLLSGSPYGLKPKKGNERVGKTSFRMMKAYIAEHDCSDSDVYKNISTMMDIQSFIDAYAVRIYMADQDWSWFKNQYLLLYDNKWHWMTYDIDYGSGSHPTSTADNNTFTSPRFNEEQSLANDPIFSYLMNNQSFRRDFVNTFMDLVNDTLAVDRIRKDRDAFMKANWDATMKSVARYPQVGDSIEENMDSHQNFYTDQFDGMIDFFENRPDYVIGYMKDYLQLEGDPVRVKLKVEDPASGSIQINTITPTLSEEGIWKGRYFTDYPVTVTAHAADGYTFVGWNCNGGTLEEKDDTTAKVSFDGEVTIEAIFEKGGE